MKVAFIDPNPGGAPGSNIGLAYVLSSVEKRHKVKLLDLSFCSKNYLRYIDREIKQYRPDIIAFSITTFTFQRSLEIARFIRTIYPDIPFIFGGVHPTLLPDETIKHPLVDAICIGEGERSMLEYLDKLEEDKEPDVEGIWHKDRNGQVHKNRLRPFEENIDGLPFPNWDHWDVEKHLDTNLYYLTGSLKYLSSRGCPYDCSFCSNKAIKETVPGKYYRVRSAENIIDEIKLNREKYSRLGFKSIAFGDEIFGLDPGWLKRFCRLYKKEGLSEGFKWVCGTRADIVNEKWAKTVADAGCKMVMLGIESGDDHIRMQVYKKEITRKDILNATSNLRNNGIAFGFYMLVGCPHDSRTTINSGISLIRELNPVTSYFSFYQPLPKTELASEIEDTMWERDRGFSDYWNIPRIRTSSLSRGDLQKIMQGIRIGELIRLLKWGIKLKKLVFIIDIVKYLFSIENWKRFFLMKFYINSDLQQKTIFKYISENSRMS